MNPHRIIRAGIAVAPTIEGIGRLSDIRLHQKGYAEPDYEDPKSGIVAFGDFSEVEIVHEETGERKTIDYTPPRVSLLLNRLGVETAQSEEWGFCNLCGKAVRLTANSSFWRPSWFHDDSGRRICRCCVQHEPSLFVSVAEGRWEKFLTFDLDLLNLGYTNLQGSLEYDPEANIGADPRSLAASLRQQGLQRFLFELIHVGEEGELLYRLWFHEGELAAQGQVEKTEVQREPAMRSLE